MELSGAFRLGSDVDRAFDRSLDWIVAGLTSSPIGGRRKASRTRA
jgi:hypothetical protein